MKRFIIGLSASLLAATASAQGLILPSSSELVRSAASEITQVETDFCTLNQAPRRTQNAPVQICFGYVRVQDSLKMRAVGLIAADGSKEIYVEKEVTGVELIVPRFKVVGPVNTPADSSVSSAARHSEEGDVALTHDAQGEVETVAIQTARHGLVVGTRSR